MHLLDHHGTGKSYRAQKIAYDNNIETIIDDGLLIKGSRVIEGVSAKTAKTKVQTVKAALFSTEKEQERIRNSIKKERIKSILILGTSDEMVKRIQENLKLPKIEKTIYIQDVSTKEEMEEAVRIRRTEGKHIVPVPTFEIKKDFSGILLDPFQILKRGKKKDKKKNKKENAGVERSVIRPAFSYFGKYTIKDKVFKDIIRLVCDRIQGITEISTIRIDKAQNSNDVEISMNMEIAYGYNIEEMAEEMKKQSKKELEYMTSVNISMVNVKIVKIEVDEEKLQEKALRYEKAVNNMKNLEKNKKQ
jgi:hypothetical protein